METKSIRISASITPNRKDSQGNGQTHIRALSFVMGLYLNDRRVNLKVSQGVSHDQRKAQEGLPEKPKRGPDTF